MNIHRWKGFVWVASLAVGGYLVYFVTDFLRQKDALAQPLAADRLAAVLDSVKKPPEQKADVVDLKAVQNVFFDLDWTGKPPPEVKVAQGPGGPPVQVVPISTLLKIQFLKVDTVQPEKSLAWVMFVDLKLKTQADKAKNRDITILGTGEHLPEPYQYALVDSITDQGVVFAFEDAAREKETVSPSPYQPSSSGFGIVKVGPGGAIIPERPNYVTSAGPDVAPYRPDETTLIRKNEYQIGTKTLGQLDQDYPAILSRDVRCSTYKNPRTGQTEGIKVNYVAPDSLPAQHGLSEGEVLKEINGHRVTSVNDAIAYVKANANATDTWVALFEKQGREFTRTYHSPDQ